MHDAKSENSSVPCRVVNSPDDCDLMAFQSAATTMRDIAKANGWPLHIFSITPVQQGEKQGIAASFVVMNPEASNIAEAVSKMGLKCGFGAALAFKAYGECAYLAVEVLNDYEKQSDEVAG